MNDSATLKPKAQPPAEPTHPRFPVPIKEPVVLAFTLAGKPYWNFTDVFKTPCLRGLQAITFYEELKKRTTPELYQEELQAEQILLRKVRMALSGETGKINLSEAFAHIADWDKILKYRDERIRFIIEPDIVWKLASVVYFDESENPYRYDMKYNLEVKIPLWKEHVKEEDFFLSRPVEVLIPFIVDYKENLPTHLKAVRLIRDLHSAHLSSIKSRKT